MSAALVLNDYAYYSYSCPTNLLALLPLLLKPTYALLLMPYYVCLLFYLYYYHCC
jgi:hypothetical protein